MTRRSIVRLVALLVSLGWISACAPDAPRGAAAHSPENFDIAAQNFQRLGSVHVSVEPASGTAVAADVRLPDAFVARARAGEWVVEGDTVWRLGPNGPQQVGPEEPVQSVRGALAVARLLGRATQRMFAEESSADAYAANRWTFVLDGRPAAVWLETRDALPRRIEIGTDIGMITYRFSNFDAVVNLPAPARR